MKYLDRHNLERLHLALQRRSTNESTLLRILAMTGMRTKELLTIRNTAIFDRGIMVTATKGSYDTVKELTPDLVAALRAMFAKFGDAELWQCLRPFSFEGLRKRLELELKHVAKVSIGINVNPHMLRHSVAMLCLDMTRGNVMAAKAILGHKSIQSTMRYLEHYNGQEAARDLFEVMASFGKVKVG